MPRDPYGKINYYFKAVQNNEPKLFDEVLHSQFRLVSSTLGKLDVLELVAFIQLFNHNINHIVHDITRLNTITYAATGTTELLFPSENFYSIFHVITTFKFNNNFIETVTSVADMQHNEQNRLRRILEHSINIQK